MSIILTQGAHRPERDFLAKSIFDYLRRTIHYTGLIFFDLSTVAEPYKTMILIERNIRPKLILDLHDEWWYDQKLYIEISLPRNLNDIGKKLEDLKLVDIFSETNPYNEKLIFMYKLLNLPVSYGSMEIFCDKSRDQELEAFKKSEKIVSILYESLRQ